MSSLTLSEKRTLEAFLGMASGYVLDFTNPTFAEFFFEIANIDIHSEQYTTEGTSKANKMRSFWKQDHDHVVARVLLALIKRKRAAQNPVEAGSSDFEQRCRAIADRLLSGGPPLQPLKEQAKALNAEYLTQQIRRMESSIDSDPSLAIGTAKELLETCCRTILSERGKTVTGMPDLPSLARDTLKELKLVPDAVPDSSRGADVTKRLLSNLSTISNGLAELRNLYGTGHGKHGQTTGVKPRHAKLAVGAASTFATFLFETHQETKP